MLMAMIDDEDDALVPPLARAALRPLTRQLRETHEKIGELDRRIHARERRRPTPLHGTRSEATGRGAGSVADRAGRIDRGRACCETKDANVRDETRWGAWSTRTTRSRLPRFGATALPRRPTGSSSTLASAARRPAIVHPLTL